MQNFHTAAWVFVTEVWVRTYTATWNWLLNLKNLLVSEMFTRFWILEQCSIWYWDNDT
jgi:hypothetical protein